MENQVYKTGTYYCPESQAPRNHWGNWGFSDMQSSDLTVPCGVAVDLMEAQPTVPRCPTHDVLYVRRKWKSLQQRMEEVRNKAFLSLDMGKIILFNDVAPRGTAKCHICLQLIAKGAERVGFDHALFGTKRLPNGAFIARKRNYVHRSCMIDVMFGGRPGKGCPGCTLKHEDQEFRAYKKMVEQRNG